jgi:hypothetical protein
MSQKTIIQNTTIRRRVRLDEQQNDVARFRTKSFTREGPEWHPVIDIGRRRFRCDCPHHKYRGAFCKHLQRAARQLLRGGTLSVEDRAALRGLLSG